MQTLIQKTAAKLDFLRNKDRSKKNVIYSIPYAARNFVAAGIYKTMDESILVVLATNQEAEIWYREAFSFIPKEEIYYLPGYEVIPYEYSRYPIDIKRDRIQAIASILTGKKGIIFTSVAGLMRTIPGTELTKSSLYLKKGGTISIDDMTHRLVLLGYERTQICEQFGQFSVKGGIVDVFTSFAENPVRIDFFGDTIDEIKIYDPYTQKSAEKIDEVMVLPADEFILSVKEKEDYFKAISDKGKEVTVKPDEHHILEELVLLVKKPVGLLEFFNKPPIIVFPDPRATEERALNLKREFQTLYAKKSKEHISLVPEQYIHEKEYTLIEKSIGINLVALPPPENTDKVLNIGEIRSFKGKIREVREKIAELKDAKIILTSSFAAQSKRLADLFAQEGIKLITGDAAKENSSVALAANDAEPAVVSVTKEKNNLLLILSDLRNGFYLEDEGIQIWTENDIFGRNYKRKSKFRKTASSAIDSFIDLKEGDHIVHINHGVGKFLKIERVTASGKERDFLKLEYASSDTLFVPLDQISLVQKYIGGSERPHLDSLGKNTWKKKRERVQESVDKLAEELVLMYSRRLNLQGYSFPKDTIWQEEFEAEFEYEETEDQLSAIEAVKADLESSKPMDRLVCGDVGYGKTEVAIRAAFKVVMAGKQVVVLVPTTILALQHYNTFKTRFENYPIKVEFISRFKSVAENKKAMDLFTRGELDVLIGTHSLLTNKLKPKNLGLLIIDEEQRFGVNHKESIKKFKNLVDVMTLTATPIPRTLHMAMTGIRDLSIIATPPKNRVSVETYVQEEDDEMIVTAIRRELERGGQVFYLYNRVESIEREARYIASLLPDISIGILHGQMGEDDIEETILDFYNKKYDLLVTTTIIESGIDMPNVNTLIVKRADTFGLSQLYQIRGRVGRSDKKAYAYLFYPPGQSMTEQAEKRLNTIYEYQELGSGFKVAMRDLEIRGAGNLLGKEQSGDIMEVGFEMYVKMLEEAVHKIKGEDIEIEVRTTVNLPFDFYLPDTYIPDTRQKIEIYKKFESAANLEEVDAITEEMTDRFGMLPDAAEVFVLLEKIRTLASNMGFESVSGSRGDVKFRSAQYFKGDMMKIIKYISLMSNLTLNPKDPSVLILKPDGRKRDSEILQNILNLLIKLNK